MFIKSESVIEDTKFLTLVKPLTTDCFNLIPCDMPSGRYDAHIGSTLRASVRLTWKHSVLQQIIEGAGVKIAENGEFVTAYNPLGALCHERRLDTPHNDFFYASVERELSYRGLKTSEQKQARFDSLAAEIRAEMAEKKDILVAAQIEKIENALRDILTRKNDEYRQALRRIVVETHVNNDWLAENVSSEYVAARNGLEISIENLNDQIKALKAKQKVLRDAAYLLKREAIEGLILADSGCGDATRAIVQDFADEKPKNDHRAF